MQIRCYNCGKPFALSRKTIEFALDEIYDKGLTYYDAVCPHCRRINKVSKKELLRAAPNWKPPEKSESEEKKSEKEK